MQNWVCVLVRSSHSAIVVMESIRLRTSCKGQPQPFADLCQQFNRETADGRKMQTYSDLLGKAIHSMIEVKEERDIDSLFSGGKTSALTQSITGLDDFELISFLVVQEAA